MSFQKLAVKAALFLSLVFAVDRGIAFVLDTGYHVAAEHGGAGVTSEGTVFAALDAKADVVVVGHSHATHNYDTRILHDALRASVYNAGKDAQGLWYVRGMVDLLDRAYTPKLYIIETPPSAIVFVASKWERVSYLAPFMDRSPVIRRLVVSIRPTEPIKYLLKSTRYNSRLEKITPLFLQRDPTFDGFIPCPETMDPEGPRAQEKLPFGDADPGLVALLHETLDAARQAGVAVVLVSSPVYRKHPFEPWELDPLTKQVGEIAKQHSVPYIVIDTRQHPEFADPALYKDATHLNGEGAARFTTILAGKLTDLLNAGAIPPVGDDDDATPDTPHLVGQIIP